MNSFQTPDRFARSIPQSRPIQQRPQDRCTRPLPESNMTKRSGTSQPRDVSHKDSIQQYQNTSFRQHQSSSDDFLIHGALSACQISRQRPHARPKQIKIGPSDIQARLRSRGGGNFPMVIQSCIAPKNSPLLSPEAQSRARSLSPFQCGPSKERLAAPLPSLPCPSESTHPQPLESPAKLLSNPARTTKPALPGRPKTSDSTEKLSPLQNVSIRRKKSSLETSPEPSTSSPGQTSKPVKDFFRGFLPRVSSPALPFIDCFQPSSPASKRFSGVVMSSPIFSPPSPIFTSIRTTSDFNSMGRNPSPPVQSSQPTTTHRQTDEPCMVPHRTQPLPPTQFFVPVKATMAMAFDPRASSTRVGAESGPSVFDPPEWHRPLDLLIKAGQLPDVMLAPKIKGIASSKLPSARSSNIDVSPTSTPPVPIRADQEQHDVGFLSGMASATTYAELFKTNNLPTHKPSKHQSMSYARVADQECHLGLSSLPAGSRGTFGSMVSVQDEPILPPQVARPVLRLDLPVAAYPTRTSSRDGGTLMSSHFPLSPASDLPELEDSRSSVSTNGSTPELDHPSEAGLHDYGQIVKIMLSPAIDAQSEPDTFSEVAEVALASATHLVSYKPHLPTVKLLPRISLDFSDFGKDGELDFFASFPNPSLVSPNHEETETSVLEVFTPAPDADQQENEKDRYRSATLSFIDSPAPAHESISEDSLSLDCMLEFLKLTDTDVASLPHRSRRQGLAFPVTNDGPPSYQIPHRPLPLLPPAPSSPPPAIPTVTATNYSHPYNETTIIDSAVATFPPTLSLSVHLPGADIAFDDASTADLSDFVGISILPCSPSFSEELSAFIGGHVTLGRPASESDVPLRLPLTTSDDQEAFPNHLDDGDNQQYRPEPRQHQPIPVVTRLLRNNSVESGSSLNPGSKLSIILESPEQWMHAYDDEGSESRHNRLMHVRDDHSWLGSGF